MSFKFELERNTAVINFTQEYCTKSSEIIESEGFSKVLLSYLKRLEKYKAPTFSQFSDLQEQNVIEIIKQVYKHLLVFNLSDMQQELGLKYQFLKKPQIFLAFTEGLYDYWRSLGRYAIAYNNVSQNGIQNMQFTETHSRFSMLILNTYRTITENIRMKKNHVYRQLIAGVQAGLIVNRISFPFEKDVYEKLKNIVFIEQIVLHPPMITYPKRNTRKGIFQEVFENPLADINLATDEFFCYPAKVGRKLAYIYFHKDFMVQGITLCNLFELADFEFCQANKADLIYVYGVKDNQQKTVFYHDEANQLYVGYASYGEDIDYFGYMKKMILTLHNIAAINQKQLPLHGAMANITLHDGSVKNIIIIGDSGAGKSETLEALRETSRDVIREIKVVFDDMGVMTKTEDGRIVAHGTEIGAFVRLDDLDTGYAYKEIDRSIFMNPDKKNARIVIPITNYDDVIHEYPIDLFLYANNYESGDVLSFFTDVTEAQNVFRSGKRMAKGTTTEEGIVESYFANPFGPLQRQEQTEVLLSDFFTQLFVTGVKVGQVRTKLGLENFEKNGPKEAAEKLLTFLQG